MVRKPFPAPRQQRSFKTKEHRKKAHQVWEEEIRQKAIQVIKAYGVTLEADRIWREARLLFQFSLPRKVGGLFLHALLLPARDDKVTIAISTTAALVRLRPFVGQMTKDLRLLLGDSVQVNLASFDSLLNETG